MAMCLLAFDLLVAYCVLNLKHTPLSTRNFEIYNLLFTSTIICYYYVDTQIDI